MSATTGAAVNSFALSPQAELEYWFHLAKHRLGAIRLDKGEPDLPPPAHAMETAVRLIQARQVKYSSGLLELKRALAAHLRHKLCVEYQPGHRNLYYARRDGRPQCLSGGGWSQRSCRRHS
jgi:hypothetical protein